MRVNTSGLSPMEVGRLNKALDKLYTFDDGVRSLRTHVEAAPSGSKEERDGTMHFNRAHYNRLAGREQEEYEARLRARRCYYIGGVAVPKVVYDAAED